MSADTTAVLFRRWPRGDILAVFPGLRHNPHMGEECVTYAHIGQHGAGTYEHIMIVTRPATPEQYAALKKELEERGYNLDVQTRRGQRAKNKS